MNKSLLTLALAAIVLTGAGTQASAQAPANVQAVDLGLLSGLKWASCNVGATAPEDYGNYYAWGETETKADYSWATYKYANGADDKFTKYCINASYGNEGFTDNKTTLEPEDDAAHVNWGGDWRMPTDAEWTELREQCTWTWTTQNGVYGYQVTSKINSNSIFLPATGYRYGMRLYYAGNDGRYWSSSLFAGYQNNAWSISFSPKTGRDYYGRNFGFPVRPVQDKQEEEVVEPAYVPKPFTVSEGKQITFSGGNLQYTQSTQTWAFAEHQYDMLGTDNVDGSTLADKIDLFGWSGSTGSAKWGISTSTDKSDYSGDFVDWGTNTIGTDAPDTWRTLTIDEWQYLFMHTRWTMAKVNGTLGFMLLPADFVVPARLTISILGDGNMSDAYKNFSESDYSANVYTASQFSQLESAGVVFLPCAGFHRGSSVGNVGSVGYYWSATPCDTDRAGYVYFGSWNAFANGWYDCSLGQSVRLVKNYSNVSTDIARPSAADTGEVRKVLRNGQVLIERNGKMYTLTGVEVK